MHATLNKLKILIFEISGEKIVNGATGVCF